MRERLYIIYAPVDPRDESVRYIGITDNIPMRFKQHLREAGSITSKGVCGSQNYNAMDYNQT